MHRPTLLLALVACAPEPTGVTTAPAARVLGVPATVLEGNQQDAALGSVAFAGDVNGDGYDDVIVGVGDYDDTEIDEGIAHLHLGSATGLDRVAAWSVVSGRKNAKLGATVAGAGDVNGDGFDDVLVGAAVDRDGDDEGEVLVYAGSATGLAAAPAWSIPMYDHAYFLSTIASAGDVNGDGFDDVVRGAYTTVNALGGEGIVSVYHGSAAGLSAEPAAVLEMSTPWTQFGAAVSGAGDVDGDGYDDLLVGEAEFSNGEAREGRALLYRGTASGIATEPAWMFEGDDVYGAFGGSARGAGDLNGDGYADVVVGGQSHGFGGSVFVFHGSATGLGAAPAWWYTSPVTGATFGSALAAAGDVDGDGYDDLLIGARYWDMPVSGAGSIQLFRGSATGLGASAVWHDEGSKAGQLLGYAVGGGGDVDGDGAPDMVASMPGYSNKETNEGAGVLYFGGCEGPWADDADGDLTMDCADCAPEDPAIHLGVGEICDGVDQDCDGTADEDAADALTWFADSDGDGFTDPATSIEACAAPAGFAAANGEDCDDASAGTFPGAAEVPDDAVDQDCDGQDAVTPPDTDVPDTDVPDADVPDVDVTPDEKGGCSSTGTRIPWLAVAGLLALRRKR